MKQLLALLFLAAFLIHCHQELPTPPKAAFSVQGGNCNAPCEVTFTSTNQADQSYTWDFGDGKTGTGTTVKHIYSSPKTYAVKLIVNGEGGRSGSTQSLTISNPAYLTLPFATMVLVKGGTFTMGDTRNEGYSNEKPVRQVTVSDFYMGQYEVTQQQWESVMGSNPSSQKGCPDCPVEQVSWNDVQLFLTKLNQQTSIRNIKFRLPTEAEWEYAAGDGNVARRSRFGNGKDIANSTEMNFSGILSKNRPGSYSGRITPVGTYAPNTLGLYDLSGNVWECCSDWFGAYSIGNTTNPTGPSTGMFRSLRGGSVSSPDWECRTTYRFNSPPSAFTETGFRVVAQIF